MHAHYDDILSRIPDPPEWFDENGTPRYCKFEPNKLANIYAQQCALVEIACQWCGQVFFVAMDSGKAIRNATPYGQPLLQCTFPELIRSRRVRYGDPPNIHCCPGGPSMTSVPRRIVEYWHRFQKRFSKPGSTTEYIDNSSLAWERDATLEIALE